jgi:hypothetical protein
MARHRRGAAEWAALIDEWKQGGLDLPEFCRRRGLSRGTMQGWVYKAPLKRAIEATRRRGSGEVARASPEATPAESPPSVAFLPVRFAEDVVPQRPTDPAAIEVILGPGRHVVVRPGFDEETLRRVVLALELSPC